MNNRTQYSLQYLLCTGVLTWDSFGDDVDVSEKLHASWKKYGFQNKIYPHVKNAKIPQDFNLDLHYW